MERGDQEATDQLWRDYKRTHQQYLRDGLILRYTSLVKFVVGRVAVGLPRTIENADLISYGVFGLIDAIEKFDLEPRVKFETYAIPRIKGAIIDGLRSADWVPRSVRSKARLVERSYSHLQGRLLRRPTDLEMAIDLGVSEVTLQKILTQISFVRIMALDDVVSGERENNARTLGETIADRTSGPVATFEVEETKQMLFDAINGLGEREQKVLSLYYYQGMTLAEIGKVLGRTESRICQIRAKAVLRLRAQIAAEERACA